ncbi:MAG: hypothetical protein CM15mP98_06520 [Paracoccaceae bacterium]|nr:MAG: hypothetical protein CM15mP98_06520 [Paracoccaceae bacterium]
MLRSDRRISVLPFDILNFLFKSCLSKNEGPKIVLLTKHKPPTQIIEKKARSKEWES